MLKARALQGKAAPAMGEAPELYVDLVPYYGAFTSLCTSRSYAEHGPNPITSSDIAAWLSIHGVGEISEKARYYAYIQALDSLWLTSAREQLASARKQQ